MIKSKLALIIAILFAPMAIVYCTSETANEPETEIVEPQTSNEVSVARGKYLVVAGACNDCHSPKIMTEQGPKVDSSKLLSGHPANAPYPKINLDALKPGGWVNFGPDLTTFVGPWGLSFSANLSSDSATGIGGWSESNFVNAIRKGKHMGMDNGRPIMPPMPWDNYAHLEDNDLKSIFAYLKTTPPISNRVHEPFSPAEVAELAKGQK